MVNKYWISRSAQDFINLRIDSRLYILHKRIGEFIKYYKAGSVLDYGGGEGFLSMVLEPDILYGYYDINPDFAKIASKTLKESNVRNFNIYHEREEIPETIFDVIVVSLVILTIFDKNEIINILEYLKQKLSTHGVIIIGDTHPCFREKVFSTFHTEFSLSHEFDYFRSKPFKVFLRSNTQTGFVSFKDFHYSLSDYFYFFRRSNLNVVNLEELKDSSIEGGGSNYSFSPYIIFILKK